MPRPGQSLLHVSGGVPVLYSSLQAVLGTYLVDVWMAPDSAIGTSVASSATFVGRHTLTSTSSVVTFPVIASTSFGGRAVWQLDQPNAARLKSANLTLLPAGSIPYCVSYHRHTSLVGGYNLALTCGSTGLTEEGWAIGGYSGVTACFSAGDAVFGGIAPVINVPRLVECGRHSSTHKRVVVDGIVSTVAGTSASDLIRLGTRSSGHTFYGEIALQMLLTSTPPDNVLASMRSAITSYFS